MVLELQDINFRFSPKKVIFDKISFSLKENGIYAFMGNNGAGKTTLFNIIFGLIKPQSGEVYFRGKNLTHQQPYIINRLGIARTFQDLRLITKLSVKDNIILVMQGNPTDNWMNAILPHSIHRSKNALLKKKADEIIEQFFSS